MLRTKILIITIFCAALSLVAQTVQLDKNWQFRQYQVGQWLDAKVPGQIHEDLLNHKLIDDPFQYSNDKKVQWIGFKDWEYQTSFDIPESLLEKGHVDLVFSGLDTYADVYLNGYMILEADNMFRTWRVDAKNYLKATGNLLRVHFKSVYKADMPKYMEAPFQLQAWPNNDQSDIWLSLYARKAGYNYGWDWGARFLTCGVWRQPYIEAWDSDRIVGVALSTTSLKNKRAQMKAIFEIESDKDLAVVALNVSNTNKSLANKSVNLNKGYNRIEVDFEVQNPQLWWSNGLGDPHLYTFDCSVDNGSRKEVKQVRTGIRTVKIVNEKDSDGQSLYVKLNGKDVFSKGANYIPLDNFVNRVSDKQYEHIIKSAVDANMNMLRVWGGGIYEKEVFYNLCDKYGIMVWQDMMFACGMFPADEAYLASVSHEVKDNVRRLRNHPSIVMWNGNNENEISYFEWGWQRTLSERDDKIYQSNLCKLFYDVIPAAINDVDASRYYHPTSPNTGYNNIGYNMGDVHLWSVWKGGDVEDYLTSVGRFMSEYGFQSYPDMFTIKKFTSKWDWYLESPVMLSHQRAKNDETRDPHFGNKMMKQYMEKYFTIPEDFEDFIYMSQYQQAEIIKVGIESHRRHKPYCMGTLYWQINDCWPVASWSSIDYYGRWKAAQYYAKKAFSEVLVSPYNDGDNLKIKVISDRQAPLRAQLELQVMTLDGNILFSQTIPISIDTNAVADVYEIAKSKLYAGNAEDKAFVAVKLKDGDKELSSNVFFNEYANKYSYSDEKPAIAISAENGGFRLTVSSGNLIRGMYLYTDAESDVFSDNYIDIIPNHAIEIFVKSESSKTNFETQLKYKTYNQIKNNEK